MDADINHVIARRLAQHRVSLGMSLAELARASGVPAATLERVERQGLGCSAADLWRVAQVLDVSISELCGAPAAAPAPPLLRAFNENRRLELPIRFAERCRAPADHDASPSSVH